MPIADELDWLCAAADDLLRAREASSARCARAWGGREKGGFGGRCRWIGI